MISGPWSLYAPSFRESAIDYGRMRAQLLAVGDKRAGARRSVPRADRRRLPVRCASSDPTELPPVRPRGIHSSRLGPYTRTGCGARACLGVRRDHPAAAAEVGAGRQRLHPSRLAGERGRHGLRRLVRVRTGPSAAATAPLAVVMHGYGEYAGYNQLYEFIRHTVRKGSIVIYPRGRPTSRRRARGRIDIEPCMTSARARDPRRDWRICGAAEDAGAAGPRRTSYFGFSFGGIITANLTNRYRRRLTCRSRGRSSSRTRTTVASTGFDEPALDDSLRASRRP